MDLRALHSFQIISLLGIVTSAVVQLILIVIDKELPHMWALYPCWLLVFLIGYYLGHKNNRHRH